MIVWSGVKDGKATAEILINQYKAAGKLDPTMVAQVNEIRKHSLPKAVQTFWETIQESDYATEITAELLQNQK